MGYILFITICVCSFILFKLAELKDNKLFLVLGIVALSLGAGLRNDNVEVKHFILSASRQTIINRLIKRGESEDCWAAQHIDICLKVFESYISKEKIDTEFRNVDEIAAEIIEKSNII